MTLVTQHVALHIIFQDVEGCCFLTSGKQPKEACRWITYALHSTQIQLSRILHGSSRPEGPCHTTSRIVNTRALSYSNISKKLVFFKSGRQPKEACRWTTHTVPSTQLQPTGTLHGRSRADDSCHTTSHSAYTQTLSYWNILRDLMLFIFSQSA